MIYLLIMFSVAAVGIASLWVQQKRERAHLESAEKFLSSLQRIAPEVPPVRRVPRKRPAPGAGSKRRRSSRSTPRRAARHPVRLDAQRREAARRRVEARRREQRRPVRSRAAS